MKSAVRFWVTPTLTSSPALPPHRSFSPGAASRSVTAPPMAYGLISRLRLPCGASRPTSVAASDTRKMPPIAPLRATAEMGSGVMYEPSFLRRTTRRIWSPHTWAAPGR